MYDLTSAMGRSYSYEVHLNGCCNLNFIMKALSPIAWYILFVVVPEMLNFELR